MKKIINIEKEKAKDLKRPPFSLSNTPNKISTEIYEEIETYGQKALI
jgi:hypothetical protein